MKKLSLPPTDAIIDLGYILMEALFLSIKEDITHCEDILI